MVADELGSEGRARFSTPGSGRQECGRSRPFDVVPRSIRVSFKNERSEPLSFAEAATHRFCGGGDQRWRLSQAGSKRDRPRRRSFFTAKTVQINQGQVGPVHFVDHRIQRLLLECHTRPNRALIFDHIFRSGGFYSHATRGCDGKR
jgi:hypothetical protein